jgi:hypothetical protein
LSRLSIDDVCELRKSKGKMEETENPGEVIGKQKDARTQQMNTPTPQKGGTACIADIFGLDPCIPPKLIAGIRIQMKFLKNTENNTSSC